MSVSPRLLHPAQYAIVPQYGLRLRDLAKTVSGSDRIILHEHFDQDGSRAKIQAARRGYLMGSVTGFFRGRQHNDDDGLWPGTYQPVLGRAAFPSGVRGSVARSHGQDCQMSIACRFKRAGVHPLTCLLPGLPRT